MLFFFPSASNVLVGTREKEVYYYLISLPSLPLLLLLSLLLLLLLLLLSLLLLSLLLLSLFTNVFVLDQIFLQCIPKFFSHSHCPPDNLFTAISPLLLLVCSLVC